MRKEKSCGAVVYRNINGIRYYLIQHMNLGHISIPKGHVEKNESEVQTALREIKEETSLDVIIDTNFRKDITYSPYEGVVKDVVFFVAESKDSKTPIDEHDLEVNRSVFLPFEEAYELLTHASDKNVLLAANKYLDEK